MKVNIRNRFFIFGALVMALFIVLFVQLVQLMLVNGEEYAEMSGALKQRVVSIPGARGSILDRNGLPLAYDEKSYNVQFYRDPTKNTETDRAYYTSIIIDTINIIENYDGEMIDTFVIKYNNQTDEYYFDWGIENPEAKKSREKSWRTNMYVSTKQDEEENYIVTPEEIYINLREKYKIPPEMGYEQARKVLSVWQESQLNSWVAYEPVTIAYNVNMQTVAEIETHGAELSGMSIEDSTVRVYPKDDVAAHVIGYLGRMSDPAALADYTAKGYKVDDLVGIEGVEKSMEAFLTGNSALRQGKELVEIDNMAVIQNVLSSTQPTQGYNVMLTLDIPMQKVVEESLAKNIPEIHAEQVKAFHEENKEALQKGKKSEYDGLELDELDLAESGAAIVLDVNTGDVLAMASNPSFDLNEFVGGISTEDYEALKEQPGDPLFNKAILSRATPGSIFKMVTGLAALMEGEIDPDKGTTLTEKISDQGQYVVNEAAVKNGAKPQGPRCWTTHPANHADQTIVEGLYNSCNYYFYTLAHRLGIDLLDKWTEKFGLTSSTGIELPGEAVGQVGSQKLLFDPSKPIDEQATSKPILVMETGQYSIVNLINNFAAERETEYEQELVKEAAKEIVYLLGIDWTPNSVNQVLEDENGISLGEHVRKILSNKLGISEKISRVQLSYDITSVLSELQWSVTKTINTGIGQEITQVTPIAVARYVAALVNGGTVYQTHIVDKVIGQDGTVLFDKQPKIFGTLDAKEEYLDAIMEGMEGVVDEQEGTAGDYFKDFDYTENIGGKTGTAQVSQVDLENNSWFVSFAPYDQNDPSVKPEIVVVVFVPNGYKGGLSCYVAKDILQYYFDQKDIVAEQTIPDPDSLVYESPSSTTTDDDSETTEPDDEE
mgnify:CR=1 FL=1